MLCDVQVVIVLKLLALAFKLVAILGFNNLVVGVIAVLCAAPMGIIDLL